MTWCEDYKDAWEDEDNRRGAWLSPDNDEEHGWADRPDLVCVELIGTAAPLLEANTVVCASYHAG